MSSLTRKDFLNLSFSALSGVLLAGLVACFNKMNPVNIINNSAATDTTNNNSSKESASNKETQPQNETTPTSQKAKMEKKAVIGIAGGKTKISVLVEKAIELAGGLGFIKKRKIKIKEKNAAVLRV